MRFTLLTSAIASAIFAATLAFAPAIAAVGERLSIGQSEIARVSAPAPKVVQDRHCGLEILEIIVVGLGGKECK